MGGDRTAGVSLSAHTHLHADYLGRFSDDTPAGWKVMARDDAWEITFPNGQSVTVNSRGDDMEWAALPSSDSATTRLWVNSLRYIPLLVQAGSPRAASGILQSYVAYVQSWARAEPSDVPGSFDHQVALQLRTACDLVALSARLSGPLGAQRDVLIGLACELVEINVELTTKLALLKPNNHGILLAVSLLHATSMFRWATVGSFREETLAFLGESFSAIFSDSGVANENSPIYQGLYVKLLQHVVNYIEWAQLPSASGIPFTTWLERVTESYRRMLLPDGSTPPLGDGCRSFQHHVKPLPGVLRAPAEGLCVCSTDQVYFSAICGARGVFHKQMDDTSVYLHVAGVDLISDGGLLSYSTSDKVARSIRSQRGHSGAFFEEFDDLDPGKVISYSQGARRISTHMDITDADKDLFPRITMRSSYGGGQVQRVVDWVSATSFTLLDRFASDGSVSRGVRRFLLGAGACLSMDDGHATIRNGEAWCVLCSPDNTSWRLYSGHLPTFEPVGSPEGLPKGFLAERQYQRAEALLLEMPVSVGKEPAKRATRITFGAAAARPLCSRCVTWSS